MSGFIFMNNIFSKKRLPKDGHFISLAKLEYKHYVYRSYIEINKDLNKIFGLKHYKLNPIIHKVIKIEGNYN